MIEQLKELCAISGISGDEGRVAMRIYDKISPHVDHVEMDRMGNVIAFKQGADHSRKVMAAAHMDEVGLILKKVDKEGFLKFETVGGIDPRILPGKQVLIGSHKVPGIIGLKAIHLQTREERTRAVPENKLYIDIGAESEEEALRHVSLGDSISFLPDFTEFGEGFIRSKALDDRAGCTILLELAKQPVAYDTYFVFTVQEEVGLRGARTATWQIAPDEAYIIETTTCADFTGCEERDHVTTANRGAVISVMDRSTIYDQELVKRAISLAREHEIPYQIKQSIAGGNDSGIVHRTRQGVRTLALSIPCRYLHSTASVIAKADIQAVHDLAKHLLCNVEEERN